MACCVVVITINNITGYYKANNGLSSSSFCNCRLLGCVPVCAVIVGRLDAADARSCKKLSNSEIEIENLYSLFKGFISLAKYFQPRFSTNLSYST